MIERLSTRTNTNGYSFQAEIDHDLQTVEYGYFLFRRDCVHSLTVGKRELKQYLENLRDNGYTTL